MPKRKFGGYAPSKRMRYNPVGIGSAVGAIKAVMPSMVRPLVLTPKMRKNLRTGGVISRFQATGGNELKYFDKKISANLAIPKTGGIIESLQSNLGGSYLASGIKRGAGPNDRIGQKCTIKKISYKLQLTMGKQDSPQATSAVVDMYLILDKQANGTTATYQDIFSAGVFNNFINITNSDRFVVIKKWRFFFNPQVNTHHDTVSTVETRHEQVKFKSGSIKVNIPIKWAGTDVDGLISATTDNNLLLTAICNDNADNQVLIMEKGTSWRLRYSDN